MTSRLLESLPTIRHGFGERGDTPPAGIVMLRQTHGTDILMVETGRESGEAGFDIVITRQPHIPIGIKTADCQSLLAVDPEAKIIAAIHAGWKGTLQRATEVAIRRMVSLGAKPERLCVALGPSMLRSCYEVERDVAAQFQKEFHDWPDILEKKTDVKWRLDVALANRRQLLRMGISPQNIEHLERCTHCYSDRFESFRRDGEKSGRMVSWIRITDA